jgi:PAS domain-containing protein
LRDKPSQLLLLLLLMAAHTPPPDEDDKVLASHMSTNFSAAHDWTASLPQTDHIRFFRNTNWAATSLGPLETWNHSLRLFAGFVLADSRAACLWVLPDYTAIYNEAYAELAAQVHPTLMGSTFISGYPELWPFISTYFDECRRTGAGVNYSSAAPTLVDRNGWREETFFSGSFTPVGPNSNQPLGFYNSTFEVTSQMLADRRTTLLNNLAAVPDHTVDATFAHILSTLATNPHDIPLAMLYKLEDGVGPAAPQLHGHIGLPEGHNLLVKSACIDSEDGLIPDMRRAGSEAITIGYDERFDSASWKGWGAPSKNIGILPITGGVRVLGYLVVGTNPFRPHNEVCQQFIRDLNRMVSSIVAAAVYSESSQRRQEKLEADLALSDLKLRHLIDHASVGMCHMSLDGQMLWANDHYYHLAGMTADEHAPRYAFFDVYLDRHKAVETYDKLLAGEDHVTVELRLKRLFVAPTGESEPAHLQILAFPYRDPETGQVKSIMAVTTDISRLKWAHKFHERRASEAREEKRQQEAFIDVVSHEMRNPLSAIVHCADAITSAMDEVDLAKMPVECFEALNENVQSAKIILQCVSKGVLNETIPADMSRQTIRSALSTMF